MTATITEAREAIQTVLSTIPDLKAYDVWPDNMRDTAAIVLPDNGDYLMTLDQTAMKHFFVVVVATTMSGGLARAQKLLDPYLSPTGDKSIRAKLRSDKTQGDIVDETIVRGYRGYGKIEINEGDYLAARIDVEVWV